MQMIRLIWMLPYMGFMILRGDHITLDRNSRIYDAYYQGLNLMGSKEAKANCVYHRLQMMDYHPVLHQGWLRGRYDKKRDIRHWWVTVEENGRNWLIDPNDPDPRDNIWNARSSKDRGFYLELGEARHWWQP